VNRVEVFDYAFIALGSNLGDSPRLVSNAMDRLQRFSPKPLLRSSLWRSDPVDCPPGSPRFINAVVGLVPRPGETPESLLKALQAMEKEFGRQPKLLLNEPRPLDLDLIAFGPATRHTEPLTLPHPRAHLRRFVLEPLAEIAPEFVLPGQGKMVRQLLAELGTVQPVARI
jgi:2-amino-4-hydroxy-6-hydroxymethyldihydropteridine diphosphokinase